MSATPYPMLDVIRRRRTARAYSARPVPRELVNDLLEAVRWAPSAANRQPWELIVVEDEDTKTSIRDGFLAEAARHDEAYQAVSGKQADLLLAPVLIAVCGTPAAKARFINAASLPEPARDELFLLSMGAAIQNLLLAAASLGLSTTWMARPARVPAIAEILGVPEDVQLVAIVAVGYGSDEPRFEEGLRTPISQKTHDGRFGRRRSDPARR
jgi:nitroreductase